MQRYLVKLTPLRSRPVPPQLTRFGAWLARQEHGSVGSFDALELAPIPAGLDPAHAARLEADGVGFLWLPDGSVLALIDPDEAREPAVVLFGSEGEIRTAADSLGEFLWLLAHQETGISDLDEGPPRPKLKRWLKAQAASSPAPTPAFDYHAWAAGEPATPPPPQAPRRAPLETKDWCYRLGPKLEGWAQLLGRTSQDPDVIEHLHVELKKKPPASLSEGYTWVSAPKQGVEALFMTSVLSEACPLIRAGERGYVPYLERVVLGRAFREPVLGVSWDESSAEALEAALGAPSHTEPGRRTGGRERYTWTLPLERAGRLQLELQFDRRLEVTVSLVSARELSAPSEPALVFLLWAAQRGLIDESRFQGHALLLAQMKQSGALTADASLAALPRGLWDVHLTDLPGLRAFTRDWFLRLGSHWIVTDLTQVFGAREGPHGHREPALPTDLRAATEAATPRLDERFAAWLTER